MFDQIIQSALMERSISEPSAAAEWDHCEQS